MTWCTGLALVGALAACGQPAAARTAGSRGLAAGSWGRAIEVPGLAALNKGGGAEVASVSCGSAGNCAAGGYYTDSAGGEHGFVASERSGVWGRAIEVPGLAALSAGGYSEVSSVSCASAGSCAAGGSYNRSIYDQGFVAVERNGVWGRAIEVPGLGALNKGGAYVVSVSCASAGNCAAGGYYYADRGQNTAQGFVASERHGRWGTAIKVPGLAALNKGGPAEVTSVSCGSAGNCAAGGGEPGFVAGERHGRWGTAIKVPGLAALKGVQSDVNSVSCASAGNCAAGGIYLEHRGGWQGFVAAERNGRWGQAIEVPGLAALNTGGYAQVDSVSCASPGNCAAGGLYMNPHAHGFVAVERNGAWGKAIQVPGLRVLIKGAGGAETVSVSCASAGSCAAGGYYFDRSRHLQVFVASENNGVWGTAIQVPGLAALSKGREAFFPTVSCAPAGTCAAGGTYTDASGHAQGFVTQPG